MSKNGLLVCAPSSRRKNIGDYIQSVAQEQFWDHIDCYCEREALNDIQSEDKINLIMNGWFMWKPQNFPPSDCINPLFVSFHIVPLFEKVFFKPETIEYLKKHEPIGARDIGTKHLLESYGIKSYFSSCLTLTLGKKYFSTYKSGEVLFVDPVYTVSGTRNHLFNIKLYFKSIYYLLKFGRKVKPLLSRFQPENTTIWTYISNKLDRLISACHFYAAYKDAFDEKLLLSASVLSHNVSVSDYKNNDDLMGYARLLVKRYAAANLIVTSRIHCALPCLAVETPVIYVEADSLEDMQKRSPGRMNGIINLFNVLNYDEKNDTVKRWGNDKISKNIPIVNSDEYKIFRDKLIESVKNFTESLQ